MKDRPLALAIVEPPPPSEGWKTLRRAIPDGVAKVVALRLHLHPDTIRCWRREPLSDDAPLSNGKPSILDRGCDLIDAIFLSHPTGAGLIVEHWEGHYQRLLDASLQPVNWNRRQHAATALREAVEAVNCLNLDAPDEETITELVEARQVIDEAITQLQKTRRPSFGGTEGSQATSESDRSGSRSDSRREN